jgi:hypothetical protein
MYIMYLIYFCFPLQPPTINMVTVIDINMLQICFRATLYQSMVDSTVPSGTGNYVNYMNRFVLVMFA